MIFLLKACYFMLFVLITLKSCYKDLHVMGAAFKRKVHFCAEKGKPISNCSFNANLLQSFRAKISHERIDLFMLYTRC